MCVADGSGVGDYVLAVVRMCGGIVVVGVGVVGAVGGGDGVVSGVDDGDVGVAVDGVDGDV